ncbi:MAG: LamG-like jellyroll fold domain-containing protein [Gammaproteobacteria bacterium]
MGVGYGNVFKKIVTNGLVFCVDAGNSGSYPGSGTTWRDLSGNSLNGTLSSTTFSSSNGGTLVFDGANSISDHGTSSVLDLTTSLTLDVWFYPTGWGEGDRGRLVDRNYPTGLSYALFLTPPTDANPNGVSYFTNGNLAGQSLFLSNCVTLNAWHNFVITHTGGTAIMYKNGSQIHSGACTQPSSSSTNFVLGNRLTLLDRTFAGSIPSFKAYNRALTAAEVTQNFNALRGRYGI